VSEERPHETEPRAGAEAPAGTTDPRASSPSDHDAPPSEPVEADTRNSRASTGMRDSPVPTGTRDSPVPTGTRGSPGPLGKRPRILLCIAGALVAVLALIGLFLLGTRLPDLLAPAPVVTPTPTPTPTPTETVDPVGPVEPGEYRWDDLLGGECLDPFVDAWQDEYTVVDCAEPHGGQLIARFDYEAGEDEGAPYPGEEALRAPLYLACTDPGVLAEGAARQYSDLTVQSSYPVTAEQWDEGHREYSCFVSRTSGEPLTGSLAVPRPEQ